jgi:DNA topoisomerase-1
VRDENKFERIIVFAKTLPKLRRRVQRDLKLRGLAREKVLATLVQLLERTFIRVGNEEYAKDNNSFGLTTLRNRHVQVRGANLRFRFRGKSGKEHDIPIEDRRIALIVKKLQELPGQDIFQYLDESGERRQVTSEDVNQYLRSIAGDAFTAKDFRTWAGTVLTSIALKELKPFENITEAKNNLKLAINAVAKILGNTATICRKCYVHPVVVSSYLEGTLVGSLMNQTKRTVSQGGKGLRLEELNVLRLLQSRLPKK